MDQAALTQRLMANEHIVWSGKPAGGLFFRFQDLFLVPFALLWLVFATSMSLGTAGIFGVSIFSFLFVGFFVGIGLFMLVGRFLLDMWLLDLTSYAVTDHCILIVRTGPFPRTTAIGLSAMPEAQLQVLAGGAVPFVSGSATRERTTRD